MENSSNHHRAWLLDLYPQNGDMILWFIAESGERLRLLDAFTPSFHLDGIRQLNAADRARLSNLLKTLDGFEIRGRAEREDFWTGRPRETLEIAIGDMSLYTPNLRKLFRQFPGLTYYNCDIAPEVLYCYHYQLFPTAFCEIAVEGDRLVACRALDRPEDTIYDPPPLREAELRAEGCMAGNRPRLRSLSLEFEGRKITWDDGPPKEIVRSLAAALREIDPDLVWTRGGDAALMPALFAMAAHFKISPGLDREHGVERKLVFDGHSFVSYGRVLYHAPDYPLFGRWHIDGDNSFWNSETGLDGLLEVARMSKMPVQRAARRSVGTGISSIQLDEAYRRGVLIPWKKTQSEAWKSAATLLISDRGGLVYQPLVGVYEDVVELDFVSMYPSIMVRENVSPETVNCSCCPPNRAVPDIGYTICRRRRGLVSTVLEPIIEKRKVYKKLRAAAKDEAEYERYDGRQGALKWLLVCCFGYLGYRNARFGRIEAHESTCAFSREKLIQAKEICEAKGYRILHAIVDCFWLQRPGASPQEIEALCREIETATNLDIAIEGRYRWIVFLPSRQDEHMPVPNRYFGCFDNGKLKFRGIEIRRSDQAPLVKEIQGELLERLRVAENLAAIRAMKDELLGIVREAERKLREREVDLEKLILRRKTSMTAEEYRSRGMTAVAARQAARCGVPLHAGEAVLFIVLNARDRDPDSRLRLVPLLRPEDNYDVEFYVEHLRRAAATILEPLLGEKLNAMLGILEKPKRRTKHKDPHAYRIEQTNFLEKLRS